MCGSHIRDEAHNKGYINLTDESLSPAEEEFLNLGLNCHYIKHPGPNAKRIEIETLIDSLLNLQHTGKITLSNTVVEELVGEAGRVRGSFRSNLLTPRLRAAARSLRNRDNLIIRKADKAAAFVLMYRDDYNHKMNQILGDSSKFERLRVDITEKQKKKLCSLVDQVNSSSSSIKLTKPIGDFSPGYIYGTVKSHKPGYPLRPIISQMSTPSYFIAKTLNKLLTPYLPNSYCLSSSTEFVDLLTSQDSLQHTASIDAESLFTNVPLLETIDIIIQRVYHSDAVPLDLPQEYLKRLLLACTTEATFWSHDGSLYRQIDGIGMGSPLGVLFANMYMGTVEERVFSMVEKPSVYGRFIDDIFVNVANANDVLLLTNAFEHNSVLHFTVEHNVEGRLPFLDVLIDSNEGSIKTSVYVKPTNNGTTMNARGECSVTYKRSVVAAFARRAITHCSSWSDVNTELDRIRQLLTNNGFSSTMIEKGISNQLNRFITSSNQIPPDIIAPTLKIFYKMFYHNKSQEEERAVKNIIKRGITPAAGFQTKFVCFFQPSRTASLIMRNSHAPAKEPYDQTNVVYAFECPRRECTPFTTTYVGMTRTSLKRRMTYHRSQGGIYDHFYAVHQDRPSVQELLEHTKILDRASSYNKLLISEAVYIDSLKPSLNKQLQHHTVLPSRRFSARNKPAAPIPAPHGAPSSVNVLP